MRNLKTRDGKLLLTQFFEPSSRTYTSTNDAWTLLGGTFIGTQNAKEMSSFAKGESIEDTVRVFSEYPASIMAIRHPETGSVMKAAAVSKIPIVNCGDGSGQHPTQSLLDWYTVEKFKGERFNNKKEGLTKLYIGDLKYGRTVRSNTYLDAKLDPTTKFIFCAPDEFQIGQDILDYLDGVGCDYQITRDLNSVLPLADVAYMTRLQEERLRTEDMTDKEYKEVQDQLTKEVRPYFRITEDNVDLLPPWAIIMHPLPIKTMKKDGTLLPYPELSDIKFTDPRSVVYIQAGNGIWVRAALELILTEEQDRFKVNFNTQEVMDKYYSHLEIH